MNELQKKYSGDDNKLGCSLQIFGFPSNQFGHQEPAENYELLNCLKYVRPGYGFIPSFPLAGKGDVNGINEWPLFTYLKARCAAPMGLIANRSDVTWTPIRNNDISWNFQKWLIRHDGQPFRRFTSRTRPEAIEDDIVELLHKCSNETQNNEKSQQPSPQQPLPSQPAPQQAPQQPIWKTQKTLLQSSNEGQSENPTPIKKKTSIFSWLF